MSQKIKNYKINNSKFIQDGQEWDYYECENLDSKQLLFAQKINCSNLNKDDINNFKSILDKIKNNQHENIINIIDILEKDQILYIITERFNYELKDYLKQQRKQFNEEELKEIMDQISDGYLHLKKLKIIHGNIDLNSIVIQRGNNQNQYIYKLNQFKSCQLQIKSNHSCTGLVFKAPELLSKSSQNQKDISDMFSFGIVLIELSSKTIKPSCIMTNQKLKELHDKLNQQVNIFDAQISLSLLNIIFSMLKLDPKARLKWDQLQIQQNNYLLNNKNNNQFNQNIQQDYVVQNQDYEIINENFIDDDFEIYKDKVIGKGNQGIIFQAKLKRNNTDIVAKQVSGHKQNMEREITIFNILKNKKHNNVIQMYYKGQDKFKDFIFLEKCDISLKDYMNNLKNDDQYIDFIRQITQGYLFLLENDIIHRDIKPDNIMIKFVDNKVQYKLIDFGVGKILAENNITSTKAGTPIYQAPEVFQGQVHNHKCDVFSFGIVIFEIILKKLPYAVQSLEDIKIFHNKLANNQYQFPYYQNDLLVDLIKQMLVYDKDQRINWRDIFKYSPIREIFVDDDVEIYFDKIIDEKKLGKIFQAKLKRNNIDIMAQQLSSHVEYLKREVEIFNILKNKKHNNVIQMYYKGQDKFKDFIFLEKCDISLKDYMNNLKNDDQYIDFIRQITQGYLFLLENNIVHGDLRPENIMIKFKDQTIYYKLLDFGLGIEQEKYDQIQAKADCLIYKAPEVFMGQIHNKQCDVFAFGILLYQIIFQKLPCAANSQEDIKVFHYKLINNLYKVPKYKNDLLIDLNQQMLIYDQKQRISWQEILKHPLFLENLIDDDFEIEKNKVIGDGNKGLFFQAKLKRNNIDLLAKEITNPQFILNREIEIFDMLKNKKHNNVIYMYYKGQDKFKNFIFLEKCDRSLKDYMKNLTNDSQYIDFIRQITQGYQFLLENNIIHGDLRPENIMIKLVNQTVCYKLIDIGVRKQIQQYNQKQIKANDLIYQAPEILLEHSFNKCCDIFSFGIMIYEIFIKQLPCTINNLEDIKDFHYQLKNNQYKFTENRNKNCLLMNLIQQMLIYDQKQRISWQEILKHPLFLENLIDDDFEIEKNKVIGDGNKGQFFQAKLKRNNIDLLAKEITNPQFILNREIEIFDMLKNKKHNNVIYMYYKGQDKFKDFIFLEKCDISLQDYMKNLTNDSQYIDFIRQITQGYLFLLENDIIHRDIKPENIMIKLEDNKVYYKFIDFGAGEDDITSKQAGTPIYWAPEVFQGQNHNHQCDVFSFGITIFQIIFKQFPYTANSKKDIEIFHNQLKNNQFIFPKYQNEMLVDLIKKMLIYDKNQRIKWQEILSHSVIREFLVDDDFEIYKDKVIGKGNQGIIFQAKLKRNNTDIVAKQVSGHKKDMPKEISIFNILKNKKHNNVVQMYYKGQDKFKDFIFLEKCDISLQDYMKKLNNDQQYIDFIRQITQGYLFLLENDILHRDIKPDNIMIKFEDGSVFYKFIDFGVGKKLDEDDITSTKAGSPIYQAPEVFQGQNHNHQCDVFSFGITIFQIIFKQFPYTANSKKDIEIFHNQLKNNQFILPQYQNGLLINLIQKMLIYEQNKRIKWREILKHPLFLENFIDDDFEIYKDKVIGKGNQGIIFQAKLKRNNTDIVAKQVSGHKQNMEREITIFNILKNKKHNNVVQMYYKGQDKFKDFIFLEKCDISLQDYMKKLNNDQQYIDFIRQITQGYLFLLENDILHRDIKPDNIMIKFEDGSMFYKLIDFGVGKKLDEDDITSTKAGSPIYQAPEVFQGKNHNHQCDVFSFGITIFQIIFKQFPHNANINNSRKDIEIFHNQLKNNQYKFPKYQNVLLMDLIQNMLIYEQDKRIQWRKILNHPVFRDDSCNLKQNQNQQINNQNIQKSITIYDLLYQYYLLGQKTSDSLKQFLIIYNNNISKFDIDSMILSINQFCLYCLDIIYQFQLEDTIIINQYHFSIQREEFNEWMQNIKLLETRQSMREILQNQQYFNDSDNLNQIHKCYEQYYLKQRQLFQNSNIDLKLRLYLERFNNLLIDYPINQNLHYSESNISLKIFNIEQEQQYLIKQGYKV